MCITEAGEVRTYEGEKDNRDNTGNMSFIHHDTDGSGGRSRTY